VPDNRFVAQPRTYSAEELQTYGKSKTQNTTSTISQT